MKVTYHIYSPTIKEIAVYNENCVMAGRAVPLQVLDSEASGNDWHDEELTEENAAEHEVIGSQYHYRIAATIRSSLAWR